MKLNGRNEIAMLEAAQTLSSTDMPEPNSLVHRGRQEKIVLAIVRLQIIRPIRTYFAPAQI